MSMTGEDGSALMELSLRLLTFATSQQGVTLTPKEVSLLVTALEERRDMLDELPGPRPTTDCGHS